MVRIVKIRKSCLALTVILCCGLAGCVAMATNRCTFCSQTIKLTSRPEGATATVGAQECVTPCKVELRFNDGPHDCGVQFEKEGYEPAEAYLTVKESIWCTLELLVPILGWIGHAADKSIGSCDVLVPQHVHGVLSKKVDETLADP